MLSLVIGKEAGGLLDMLRYARQTTIKTVDGLTASQLDHQFDSDSNSIGALLLHIAAVESWYQINTFEGRTDFDEDEKAKWSAWIELGEASREPRNQPLDFYLDTLAAIRARTERELRTRDDDWLWRVEPFEDVDANNYWKWFHVCEDEINHRGQIRWLKKRLPAAQ
jgi:uncharacterized damage-inducible protein DinB